MWSELLALHAVDSAAALPLAAFASAHPAQHPPSGGGSGMEPQPGSALSQQERRDALMVTVRRLAHWLCEQAWLAPDAPLQAALAALERASASPPLLATSAAHPSASGAAPPSSRPASPAAKDGAATARDGSGGAARRAPRPALLRVDDAAALLRAVLAGRQHASAALPRLLGSAADAGAAAHSQPPHAAVPADDATPPLLAVLPRVDGAGAQLEAGESERLWELMRRVPADHAHVLALAMAQHLSGAEGSGAGGDQGSVGMRREALLDAILGAGSGASVRVLPRPEDLTLAAAAHLATTLAVLLRQRQREDDGKRAVRWLDAALLRQAARLDGWAANAAAAGADAMAPPPGSDWHVLALADVAVRIRAAVGDVSPRGGGEVSTGGREGAVEGGAQQGVDGLVAAAGRLNAARSAACGDWFLQPGQAAALVALARGERL